MQRGIVVLATKKFLILQSSNGSLHLWLLSGATQFQNVSNTTAGTQALTASTSATQQAMTSGNMIPATTLLAGSPTTAAAMLTPTAGSADRHGPGGEHQPHRDGHRDQEHGDGIPDRDHPVGGHADVEPHHVHPERVAGHNRLARGDLALVAGHALALDAARPAGPVQPAEHRRRRRSQPASARAAGTTPTAVPTHW